MAYSFDTEPSGSYTNDAIPILPAIYGQGRYGYAVYGSTTGSYAQDTEPSGSYSFDVKPS